MPETNEQIKKFCMEMDMSLTVDVHIENACRNAIMYMWRKHELKKLINKIIKKYRDTNV